MITLYFFYKKIGYKSKKIIKKLTKILKKVGMGLAYK